MVLIAVLDILKWSDVIVIGPGLGTSDYAKKIEMGNNSYYIVYNVLYKAIRSEGKEKYEVTNLDRKTMYYIKDYFASAK